MGYFNKWQITVCSTFDLHFGPEYGTLFAKYFCHVLECVVSIKTVYHTSKSIYPFWRHSCLKYSLFAPLRGELKVCKYASILNISKSKHSVVV